VIKYEKRCKYAKDILQSLKTTSEMWKAQPRLYWAFHISEGTVCNYCKIRTREHPENTKEKSPVVFTVSACQRKGNEEKKRWGSREKAKKKITYRKNCSE